MAKDYTALAEQMVAPIYNQLETGANEQIKTAETDPYYTALLSGLDATKNREFSGIESRAAQRGVAYGNIPSQIQSVYLGEKYMPAVAEVKKTQLDRINSLKQTLAELRSKRAGAVLDQANLLEGRDYEAEQARIEREFKAQQAALDRAADGGGSSTPQPGMMDWFKKFTDYDGLGWQEAADKMGALGYNIEGGSPLDIAFRKKYMGTENIGTWQNNQWV